MLLAGLSFRALLAGVSFRAMLAGLSFRAMLLAKHHLSNWHRAEVVPLNVGCVAAVEMPHCVDGSVVAKTGVKLQHRVATSAVVAGREMQHRVDTYAAVAGPHTDSSATPVAVLLADCAAHLPVPMGDYYYDYNYTRS